MIYLYDSTETDFRYNGKPLPAAYDVAVSNTLNSEYYVMGKYPLDKDKVYKEIVEDRIIKVHTMDGMEPFRIVNVSKYELYVEFEAWPLFYADMRNKLVKPLNLKGVSGQTALNAFKNNLLIDTPFDFYSDITTNHDYHTQDKNERENNPKQLYNALDVFKTIVSRWGGELWIRGYDIRVNKRIGTDTEAMLYEKKNITEFVDTTNIEGIVTRLHGKSEWQDERQEGEEEGQKHSIEVTVDSPLINDYSGVIFEKQYTNNDIRTEQELKNWLNLKFTTENIDKPQRTIEVGTNVIDGTKIGFADTLILKYIKHDTDVRIKVVGYEYDGFADELKHVVLGQPKNTSSSTIGNTITDLVNNVVEPVDRKTTIAMNSADGKSTVFHGTADPNTLNLNAKENDTYFRTNGNEKEIWRFTGTLWELIMDTSDTTKVAEDILEAKSIAEIARDNALNIATDLLEGTSFYKHTQDIGLASKNSDGTVNSIINLGSDGTAYIGGRNIVLDGNTIVDGTFTITDKMIAPNAEIDGAKIADATIGSAKIANLDVGKISGNKADFIRAGFDSASGGSVQITGDGMQSTHSNGSNLTYNSAELRWVDPQGDQGVLSPWVLENNSADRTRTNHIGLSLYPTNFTDDVTMRLYSKGVNTVSFGNDDINSGYEFQITVPHNDGPIFRSKYSRYFDFVPSNFVSGWGMRLYSDLEYGYRLSHYHKGLNSYGNTIHSITDEGRFIFTRNQHTSSARANLEAAKIRGTAYEYVEDGTVYNIPATISAIIDWIGSEASWVKI